MEGFEIITDKNIWNQYYSNVIADFEELKDYYPFCTLSIPPSTKPELATIKVVAANKVLIESTGALKTDFTEEYSRELFVIIPFDYRKTGCKVYGAMWIDIIKFEDKDIHFYEQSVLPPYGYELCVGVPESFPLMKNVILENVKTAENMLIAYERVMSGESERLELIAYAHGNNGRKQYRQNNTKYKSGVKNDV